MTTELSRRSVLLGGAAAAGLALTGVPAQGATSKSAWPTAKLTGASAQKVTDAQFMPRRQIHAWQEALNDVGLRATGSTSHHRYIDGLASRMERVGLKNVTYEGVGFNRWTPGTWSLDVVGGSSAGKIRVAWYVPYSGSTPSSGVTAPLTTTPTKGAIGLITVKPSSLPYLLFDVIDYDTPLAIKHPSGYSPLNTYDRVWMAQGPVVEGMEAHKAAGALGLVVILDLPREAADGQYMPYDGKIRGIPSLFVDREQGAVLTKVAESGGKVRLKLTASTQRASTPNVYGIIPGASQELVMVQSHTDGTNGLEENGPEAMLAMAQYLARVPRKELPRSILFVMSTGHMSGMAMGTEAFLRRHKDDLVKRTAAAMSVEHLGAHAWLPDATGKYVKNGYEDNIVFSSPHTEMIKVARQIQNETAIGSNRVMRPYAKDTEGLSPNGFWWPGDGEGLWRISGLPSMQSIAGPTYLLNSNFDAMPLIDTALMRRQAIAFTNATLRLARTPWNTLRAKRIEDPLFKIPLELVNATVL